MAALTGRSGRQPGQSPPLAPAAEMTSLRESVQQLASELSSLQEARQRTDDSFERMLGFTLEFTPKLTKASLSRKSARFAVASHQQRGRAVVTTSSRRSTLESADSEAVHAVMSDRRSVRWSIDSAADKDDKNGSKRPSVFSTLSMAYSATTVEDPWVAEVIDRILGAIERGSGDPREVFDSFCPSGTDCMQQADLERVVKFFAPELPESHHSKLWESLYKDDDDILTFEEFADLLGVPASPEYCTWRQTSASPIDRQERIICYRFGRAWSRSKAACNELESFDANGQNEMAVQQLLQLCSRHKLSFSRAEVVKFFTKHAHGDEMSTAALWDAIEVASGDPPPEIQWAEQTIAVAGVKARARGGGIGGELAQLGDGEAAPFHELRHTLAPHLGLEEEQWKALMWALDKRQDDAIVLQPVVQLATRMCGDEHEGHEGHEPDENRPVVRLRRRTVRKSAAALPGLREDDEEVQDAEDTSEDEQR